MQLYDFNIFVRIYLSLPPENREAQLMSLCPLSLSLSYVVNGIPVWSLAANPSSKVEFSDSYPDTYRGKFLSSDPMTNES